MIATILWALILSILFSKGECLYNSGRCVQPPWGDRPSHNGHTSRVPDPCLGLSVNTCEQSVCVFGLCARTSVCMCMHEGVSTSLGVWFLSACVHILWAACLPTPCVGPKTGSPQGGKGRVPRSPGPRLQEPLSAASTERRVLLGHQDLLRTNGERRTGPPGCAAGGVSGTLETGRGWVSGDPRVPGTGPERGRVSRESPGADLAGVGWAGVVPASEQTVVLAALKEEIRSCDRCCKNFGLRGRGLWS